MSDHTRALRERVEAKHGPIAEIEVPTDPAELAELAGADPDKFNAIWESGRIPAEALGADTEEEE